MKCNELRQGQIYVCKDCGLELQVIKECAECGSEDCCEAGECKFLCCDEELVLKA